MRWRRLRKPPQKLLQHTPRPWAEEALRGHAVGTLVLLQHSPRPWAEEVLRGHVWGAWCWPCRLTSLWFCFLLTEEKEAETGAANASPKESESALMEDRDESEVSDEGGSPISSEGQEPRADPEPPGLAAGLVQQDVVFEVGTPAVLPEPVPQEDGVDLLGLHSEVGAGPAVAPQALKAPSSNTDLLSCLLGPPEATSQGPPEDLLGEAPLLLANPAPPLNVQSTPRGGPPAAGTCFCSMAKGFTVDER